MMQAIEAEVSKQGIVKFCQPIQLDGCYRAIVTLVEPIESSDQLLLCDEEFCSFPSSSLGMRALKLLLPQKQSGRSLKT